MSISTGYAKIIRSGRRLHKVRNTPILTFHDIILDYPDLERTLLDMGRKIYRNYQQLETEVSIWRHLKGRYKRGIINYREAHIRYNRLEEIRAIIVYNPDTDAIKIKRLKFSTPEAYYKFQDGWDRARNKKWKLKPLVEKGFMATLLNPESSSFNFLTVKSSNYGHPPTTGEPYATWQEQHHEFGSYGGQYFGSYGSIAESTVEREEVEKDNRH